MAAPGSPVKRARMVVMVRDGSLNTTGVSLVCYSLAMLPRPILRILSRLFVQPYFRVTRGQTLGVRGVVRDESGCFLLVRHTYVKGWMLPGGGVDHGESMEEAVVRELREETGVIAGTRPRLISVHTNFKHFKGDHVAVFAVDDWEQEETSSLEIAEIGFFPADDLPEGTTVATKNRIAEIIGDGPAAPHW